MTFSRQRKTGKTFYVSYRHIPSGKWKALLSGPSEKAAKLHEARLEIEYQQFLATGVFTAPASKKSKGEHVTDFLRYLEQTATVKYCCSQRARLMLAMDNLPELAEVTLDDALVFLDALRSGRVGRGGRRTSDSGASVRTRDEYARILRQFGEWMVDEGRLRANPFRRLRYVMVRGRDETYVRRALSLQEVRRLADAVGGGGAVLIFLAATTGLRVGEIRALRWHHMWLNHRTPHIHLPGEFTKNGKDAVIPLQQWLVDMIRQPSGAWGQYRIKPVFIIPKDTAKMIREIAVQAGVPTIDDQGRILDFHSLRSSTFRILDELGVNDVAIMKTMRHAKYQTTLDYYDKGDLAALAAAVQIPNPRSEA